MVLLFPDGTPFGVTPESERRLGGRVDGKWSFLLNLNRSIFTEKF